MRWTIRGRCAALIAGGLLILPGTSIAASGDVDGSFGTAGVVITEAGRDDYGQDIAADAAGRTIVVGSSETFSVDESSVAVARYTKSGVPDTTFDGDGLRLIDLPGHHLNFGNAVAIDPSGRILVAGGSCVDDSYGDCFGIIVARLTGSGQLDPTFGGGDGIATGTADNVRDVVLDSQGRILVVGGFGGDLAVFRLTATGAFDTSFSGDGIGTAEFPNPYSFGYDLGVDAQGRIIAAGESAGENVSDFAVARFLDSGNLDPAFSGDGKLVTDFGNKDYAYGVAIDGQDRPYVVGTVFPAALSDPWRAAIIRYTQSGSPDATFGGGAVFGDSYSGGVAAAVDGTERLLFLGGGEHDALQRYLPGGGLDPSFGSGGVSDPMPFPIVEDLVLDPWRRIVIGGTKWNGTDSDLAATRFESGDPMPPTRTLAVDIVGSGAVIGPAIDCPGDCGETFAKESLLTLIADPAPGFGFTGWTGACSGAGACELKMDNDSGVTATFTAQPAPSPDEPVMDTSPPASNTGPQSSATPKQPNSSAGRRKTCRKGFKKKRVRGKVRCVKKKQQKNSGRSVQKDPRTL